MDRRKYAANLTYGKFGVPDHPDYHLPGMLRCFAGLVLADIGMALMTTHCRSHVNPQYVRGVLSWLRCVSPGGAMLYEAYMRSRGIDPEGPRSTDGYGGVPPSDGIDC